MKAVVQRVLKSSVTVDNKIVGKIGPGFTILLGIVKGDNEQQADLIAGKIAGLRVFSDAEDKMNLSLSDIGGSVLVISQFTLCADIKKGNRPSFTSSADPADAKRLYEYFIKKLQEKGIANVQTGIFAAKMKLEIINDGPVTILYDTNIWSKNVI